jgi:hypothetical protein
MSFTPPPITSPDLSGYVNLTLFDLEPSQIVADMLVNSQTLLPDWVPQQGNTEMVLAQGLSIIVSELVYAINRVPGAVFQTLLLAGFGIQANLGAPSTATVTFNLVSTDPYTIPAGTQVQLSLPLGIVTFVTQADTLNAVGADYVTVPVTATVNTAAPNGTPIATPVSVTSSTLWSVNSAVLASEPTGGLDPESTSEWLSRAATVLQNLNSTLVLPDQFTTYALSNGAFRAYTQDNYDATTTYSTEGVISVAVIGEGGNLLTSGQKTDMQLAMNEITQANLVVRVVDPTITLVNVTAEVMAVDGQDPTMLQGSVVAAIHNWLSTDTWPWDATVRYFKLINVLETVQGVDWVVSVTTPTTDVALSGFGPLAQAGIVTITVDTH